MSTHHFFGRIIKIFQTKSKLSSRLAIYSENIIKCFEGKCISMVHLKIICMKESLKRKIPTFTYSGPSSEIIWLFIKNKFKK